MKDAEVECEKRRALELQMHVVDLESQLSDSTFKFETLVTELEVSLLEKQTFLEAKVKDFENHKVRYDMLVAEKDGVCGEVDNLKAELRSRDIDFKQMEEQLNQLVSRQTGLVFESGTDKNTVEELRLAIRQLCFSLDHYKTGYRQLMRFLSNK